MTSDGAFGAGEVVYLDHAATSPLLPEALEAMLPFLGAAFANPSSAHRRAREVRRALDEARECLAALLRCTPDELVFTSGGTESDNLAVKGAAAARGGGVVVSAVEHHAVLRAAARVGGSVVAVDGDGRIDLDALAEALSEEVVLVSVMAANNETGVVQPLEEVFGLVRRLAPEALVHSDAVQAFGYLDPGRLEGADLVSYSAHKFGGPKGVGALVVREGARPRLRAILEGGSQEHELRAGTENVPGIVAMAAAASAVDASRDKRISAVLRRRERLARGISRVEPTVSESGRRVERIASICHLVFPDVEAEELLMLLDEAGVAASAGAACASGALEPSHVLLAMGHSKEEAKRAVRFSLAASTSDEEVDHAVAAVAEALARLRAPSRRGN
jgi:cysteine desulfurase